MPYYSALQSIMISSLPYLPMTYTSSVWECNPWQGMLHWAPAHVSSRPTRANTIEACALAIALNAHTAAMAALHGQWWVWWSVYPAMLGMGCPAERHNYYTHFGVTCAQLP